MENIKVHPQFKLNGISFNAEELVEVAYSFIKEGEEYEQIIGDFLLDWLNNSETIVVKTSGSTGKPKQITIKKQQMVNSAQATGTFLKLQPGNKALLCLSAGYIAGKMMLVRALVLGLNLDCVSPVSSPLLDIQNTYDFSAMVPMQLEASISNLHRIKTLIVGGAPLSIALIEKIQTQSTTVYETYGMTETITHIALKKVNNNATRETLFFEVLPDIVITQDDRNCLVINAPQVADESIITNDVVALVSETEFIWLGRHDYIINSGGIKLHPEQIETKLATILNQPYFVYGEEDNTLGEKLVLLIEGKIDVKVLHQKLIKNEHFDRYEIPKQIHLMDHFVRTLNGKIQRAKTIALLNRKP